MFMRDARDAEQQLIRINVRMSGRVDALAKAA